MRPLVLAVTACGFMATLAAPAHAMGRYVDLHLVAWNTDGTAALFTRTDRPVAPRG